MAKATMTLTVKVAWWLPLYLHGVAFVSMVMGLEPDMAKVEAVVTKGVKVVVR